MTCLYLSGCGKSSCTESGQSDTTAVELKEFKDIKAKADKGDIESQCWLAICYSNGLFGCKIDKAKSQELFQKVARHSNENLAAVQHAKGVCYKNGYGVTKDPVEAVKWYRKAADQGFAPAQNSLGVCNRNGEGVPQDDQKMFEWYSKAADQGYANARYYLAECYKDGKGVPQSHEEAMKWYRFAALQGYDDAQFKLGVYYFMQDDYSEAMKWVHMAADQGHVEAQITLGISYYNGKGVQIDLEKSLFYISQAAKQGHPKAKEFERMLQTEIAQTKNRKANTESQMAAMIRTIPDPSGILQAVLDGNLKKVKEFVQRDAKLLEEKFGEKELTLMHIAAIEQNGVLKFLIEQGANARTKDKYGWTPIAYAGWAKNHEAILYLLANGSLEPVKDCFQLPKEYYDLLRQTAMLDDPVISSNEHYSLVRIGRGPADYLSDRMIADREAGVNDAQAEIQKALAAKGIKKPEDLKKYKLKMIKLPPYLASLK